MLRYGEVGDILRDMKIIIDTSGRDPSDMVVGKGYFPVELAIRGGEHEVERDAAWRDEQEERRAEVAKSTAVGAVASVRYSLA